MHRRAECSSGSQTLRPRELKILFAACAIAVFASGCSFGPIWSRTLTGQVVDAGNGRPIPGAEVFAWYPGMIFGIEPSYGLRWDFNQTTTDSDGHFTIPGHFAPGVNMGHIQPRPTLHVFHPDYGETYIDGDEVLDWRDVRIALGENELTLDLLIDLDEACRWLAQEVYIYQLAFRPGACTWDRSAHP